MDLKKSVEEVLEREVLYDGKDFDRKSLASLVEDYSHQHEVKLRTLEELSQAHRQLSTEMTSELAEQKSAWEYVGQIVSLENIGSNVKGLLEKIPIIREVVPERPLHVLLTEKMEVAQRRTQEVGNHLDRIQAEIENLRSDIERLNKRMVLAAHNEEAAASYVLELKQILEKVESHLQQIKDQQSAEYRQLQTTRDSIKHRIWEHGARLRNFSAAENRIADIIRMNNSFMEILHNLHSNMRSLYDAGNDVLGELQGNLTALASAAQASEVSVEMQRALVSLKDSVNRVASLASETSLYLTQNVERMTTEMRIYDEATQQLVESNLKAEREIQEERINETIALAEKELKAFDQARQG